MVTLSLTAFTYHKIIPTGDCGYAPLLYYVIGGGVTLLFVSAQPFGGGFGRDQNMACRNLKPKGKKTL